MAQKVLTKDTHLIVVHRNRSGTFGIMVADGVLFQGNQQRTDLDYDLKKKKKKRKTTSFMS
jgi:hypothetical protein